MADPYQLLGVTPQSSPEEVETRYRLLLREYHPDLHFAEGPEAVARYEALTRQLNDAMARVRADWRSGGAPRGAAPGGASGQGAAGPWWSVPRDDGTGDGPGRGSTAGPAGAAGPWWATSADTERDWFGNPIRHEPDAPVPCPYCGAGFSRLAAFEAHLVADHQVRRHGDRAPRDRPVRRALHSLRYVPLWLIVPPTFLSFFYAPLVVFFALMTFLALVLYAQGTNRFRDDWWWKGN